MIVANTSNHVKILWKSTFERDSYISKIKLTFEYTLYNHIYFERFFFVLQIHSNTKYVLITKGWHKVRRNYDWSFEKSSCIINRENIRRPTFYYNQYLNDVYNKKGSKHIWFEVLTHLSNNYHVFEVHTFDNWSKLVVFLNNY